MCVIESVLNLKLHFMLFGTKAFLLNSSKNSS